MTCVRTHSRLTTAAKHGSLLQSGLPADEPVNSVREDTQRKGLLFAATEKSVYVSADDGDHWASLQINLPRTSMRDLWIHDNDLIVGTHGRSIWILDDISILRQLGCCQPPREVDADPTASGLPSRTEHLDGHTDPAR